MNLIEKEQMLHKVVAASAFLFALSILPVAQFVLQKGYLDPNGAGSGQVAGATTEKETVRGNVPPDSQAACQEKKDKELAELADWQKKTSNALKKAYDKDVEPYQQAIPVLTGTPENIEKDKEALNGLIEQEKQAYLKKVSDFEKAAASQKDAIESRGCSAE